MRVGIVDYLLRARESACFYLAAELGFDSLDLAVERIGDPTRLLFMPDRQKQLLELVQASGVSISSLVATHFLNENLLAAEERRRRPAWLALHDLTLRAVALNVPTVVVPLLGASDVTSDTETMALLALVEHLSAWRDLGGVRLALKTALPAEELIVYLERAKSTAIGVCFDPSITTAMGLDPVRELRLLAGRVFHVHLKDRSPTGPAVALGSGALDLQSISETLAEIGYSGPLVLDTPAGSSPVESARSNLVYCRRLVA